MSWTTVERANDLVGGHGLLAASPSETRFHNHDMAVSGLSYGHFCFVQSKFENGVIAHGKLTQLVLQHVHVLVGDGIANELNVANRSSNRARKTSFGLHQWARHCLGPFLLLAGDAPADRTGG